MKATFLRKKYPDFWAEIETAVWEDTAHEKGGPRHYLSTAFRRRIAYNAAFHATLLHHKAMRARKKR